MSVTSLSTKGQITLPAKVRKKLGLKPGDKLSIESTEEEIVIRRVPDFLSFKGVLGKSLPLEQERQRMMEYVADRVLKGRR